MTTEWSPVGIVPADAADETIEALVRIYVGRVASVDESDVVLGEYERAVLLLAQAEVALVQAAGRTPHLMFSGPPLHVEVLELDALRRPPQPGEPFDQGA